MNIPRRSAATHILPLPFLIFLLLVVRYSEAQQFYNDLEDSVYPSYWINQHIVRDSNARSGTHYAVTHQGIPYGLGFENRFPEALRGKNTRVHINGWVRSDVSGKAGSYVITVINRGKTVFWKSVDLSQQLLSAKQWYAFHEEVLVPASFTSQGLLKTYLWNNDGNDTLAIDDLSLTFKEAGIRSFVPKIPGIASRVTGTIDSVLVTTNFYSIHYNKAEQTIALFSKTGLPLIGNILYFSESKTEVGVESLVSGFTLDSSFRMENEWSIHLSTDQTRLHIHCIENDPEISFSMTEQFPAGTEVHRSSLIFSGGQEVTRVYRANRKVDTADFQEEYWLGKEGAQFGTAQNSWLIYHPIDISSMQLRTGDTQLWVNLDYERDHPFLHFPLLEGRQDVKLDYSSSKYLEETEKKTAFNITVGQPPAHLPRFMKNPSGFLAAYIWTEHADFTDIRTNRAAFFGSESIKNPKKATGGFAKYDIPVTKSVFYRNREDISNWEASGGKFSSNEAAIKNKRAYFRFLRKLKKTGHEICLHTPEHFTSNAKDLERSMQFMQKKFETRTWIDHGYNNGLQNNREDLVCDGTDPASPHFALNYWNEFEISYFWNPYYEDYFTFDSLQFGEMLSKPYHGFGDYIPDPDFWKHPSRTGQLIHWPTKSVHFVKSDALWDFLFNDQILDDFVEGWCVQFNHCYPAWVNPEKGFWYFNQEGKATARKGFNSTLERMAKRRDEGLLNLPTVSEFLNYQLALEKINYRVLPNGDIEIYYAGESTIHGLSFAVRSTDVLIDGRIPQRKKIGDDLIFWFDILPGETKIIDVTP
ncbi:MAG: hypothetical protein P8100_05555 [bacterium]